MKIYYDIWRLKTVQKNRLSNCLLFLGFVFILLLNSISFSFNATHKLNSLSVLSNISEKCAAVENADLPSLSFDKNSFFDKSFFIEMEENNEEDEDHSEKNDFSLLSVVTASQPYLSLKAQSAISNIRILRDSFTSIPLHIKHCVFLI